MSLRLCENFDYLSQASLFFFKITGKRESCLPLFFSRVQELEATLYPLVSVCMCVCMYVCVSASIVFLPINHKRMIGSWWYLDIRLIFMRQKSLSKFKVMRSKVKVKYAIIEKIVLAINHERVIGWGWYLYIWLISMSSCVQWSWARQFRPAEPGARLYKHSCPRDCFV